MTIEEQLIRDEGIRLKPYKDSVGKLTIGVGRNLDDVGISQDEATLMLSNDIAAATRRIQMTLPWAASLDMVRFNVLVNMSFNLGYGLFQFKQTLAAIEVGNWSAAAVGMLSSKWAMQVGARATRLAEQMRTGEWQ